MNDDSRYCDKCGTKLREDGEFCEECGKKIIRVAKKKSLDEIEKEVKEKVDAEFSARQEAEFRKQKEKELRNQKEWEIQEKKRQKLAKQQAEIVAAERRRLEQIEKERQKEQELREKRRREQKEHFYAVLRKKKTQKTLAIFLAIILIILIVPYAAIQIMTMQENQRLAEEAKRAAEEAKKIAEENMLDEAAADQLWLKTYGAIEHYGQQSDSSLGLTSDGGYITTGYIGGGAEGAVLIKTDANGVEQWNKTSGSGSGEFVQQTKDGGYVIVTYNRLVKTDANGTELWNRPYSGTALDGAQTSDGGYIIASYTYDSTNGYSTLLIKTDANGTELWNRTFDGGEGRSIKQTNDGGYIIAGRTFVKVDRYIPAGIHLTQVGAGWLVKTDANGVKQWNRTFENHLFYSVKQTFDGGYIIGSNEEFWIQENDNYRNAQRTSLIKTDENGNMQWHTEYSSETNWFTVLQTTDGGYVVAGNNNLYKTDNNGNKLWNKTYDSGLYICSCLQTADNGYIISGTYSINDNHDIFLLKTVGKI